MPTLLRPTASLSRLPTRAVQRQVLQALLQAGHPVAQQVGADAQGDEQARLLPMEAERLGSRQRRLGEGPARGRIALVARALRRRRWCRARASGSSPARSPRASAAPRLALLHGPIAGADARGRSGGARPRRGRRRPRAPAASRRRAPRARRCRRAAPRAGRADRGSARASRAAASAARRRPAPRRSRPRVLSSTAASCTKVLCHVRGGAGVVLGGIAASPGALVVLRRGGEQPRAEHAGMPRQPVGGPGMGGALDPLEHRVVGDLVQDLVAEGVLANAVARRLRCPLAARPARARAARAAAPARAASTCCSAASQNVMPITLASCSARRSGGGRPSSRACSTPVSVGGTLSARSRSASSDQRSPERRDRALVDQHLDQLFHVERDCRRRAR